MTVSRADNSFTEFWGGSGLCIDISEVIFVVLLKVDMGEAQCDSDHMAGHVAIVHTKHLARGSRRASLKEMSEMQRKISSIKPLSLQMPQDANGKHSNGKHSNSKDSNGLPNGCPNGGALPVATIVLSSTPSPLPDPTGQVSSLMVLLEPAVRLLLSLVSLTSASSGDPQPLGAVLVGGAGQERQAGARAPPLRVAALRRRRHVLGRRQQRRERDPRGHAVAGAVTVAVPVPEAGRGRRRDAQALRHLQRHGGGGADPRPLGGRGRRARKNGTAMRWEKRGASRTTILVHYTLFIL